MLTLKHQVKQALSMRTRGVCTLQPGEHPDKKVKQVVLAKSSVSPPNDCKDKNGFVVDLYLNRYPGQKTMTRPFVSVRDQYLKMSDVFRVERKVRLNLEFDFKRKPVNPRMVGTPYGEVLSFDTVPWANIEDAELVRAIFDGWRNDRCLKTLQDWDDWQDHYHAACLMEQMRAEKRGGLPFQLTKKGSLGMLMRLFLRAYVQKLWGLEKTLGYAELVTWMQGNGFDVSVDDVKNGSRGVVLKDSIPATPRTRKALALLKERFPSFVVDEILFEGYVP